MAIPRLKLVSPTKEMTVMPLRRPNAEMRQRRAGAPKRLEARTKRGKFVEMSH
jgi:hypothetical protein